VLIEQVRIAEHHLNGPVTKDRCDGPEVHLVHEQLTRGGIPQASIALPGRIGAYPWCMQSLLLRDYDFGKVKKKVALQQNLWVPVRANHFVETTKFIP
jgi:hypothetical protein